MGMGKGKGKGSRYANSVLEEQTTIRLLVLTLLTTHRHLAVSLPVSSCTVDVEVLKRRKSSSSTLLHDALSARGGEILLDQPSAEKH